MPGSMGWQQKPRGSSQQSMSPRSPKNCKECHTLARACGSRCHTMLLVLTEPQGSRHQLPAHLVSTSIHVIPNTGSGPNVYQLCKAV